MLTAEQYKKLKQLNVSKDADKTKDRLKTDFNAASSADKRTIVNLSGQARNSFYRSFEKGTANARIILAMAEGLKVSPLYYTGEIDERAELADADIVSFLQGHGYADLVDELSSPAPQKPKRKYNRKPKAEPVQETAPEPEEVAVVAEPAPESQVAAEQVASAPVIAEDSIEIKITLPENQAVHDAVNALTEDEIIALMKALLIKEKAGGAPAKMVEIIKRCLLS